MEFVVFSDLHGNSRALKAMLSALDPSRTYAFICCGDITGYYYDELEIRANIALNGLICVSVFFAERLSKTLILLSPAVHCIMVPLHNGKPGQPEQCFHNL